MQRTANKDAACNDKIESKLKARLQPWIAVSTLLGLFSTVWQVMLYLFPRPCYYGFLLDSQSFYKVSISKHLRILH